MTSNSASDAQAAQTRLGAAFHQLAVVHGELAGVLANLMAVVAEEALQNAGFGARLSEVLTIGHANEKVVTPRETRTTPVALAPKGVSTKARPKRGRRAPGPWDPYSVYAEVGESGLREQLNRLELEQLRDIVAEHSMNNDGLAMRWTKAERLVGRIVDRVVDRSAKGDAFRRA
jgi:hypothetical protein